MAFTREQRHVVVASFLGWTLDAFDFFLMVFMLKDIARDFGTEVTRVTLAILLTLALRPIGALLFGRIADRFGRRPTLMVNVLLYSALEFASGFAPGLWSLLAIRALFGVAMGGEWGVGSALAMESIPVRSRGLISGLLQAGYPTGYLLASAVFGLLYDRIGWRGMFMVGIAPALLVLYIRRNVPESPAWGAARTAERTGLTRSIRREWKLALYTVVLMTCFNSFSHGTQDLYPTFLLVQRGFSTHTVSLIAITYNVGAILGGLAFGAFSERIGRRRAIALAALLALPVLPLWAFSTTAVSLAIGAFLMRVAVQEAWGVVPAHLNELSPGELRATFPGLVYQLGNLIAAGNGTFQAAFAKAHGGNYALSLALLTGTVAVLITVVVSVGPERLGTSMAVGGTE